MITTGEFEQCAAAVLGGAGGECICLAAVSGGADSTAMLAALAALREQAGFDLRCLHVEHGIRAAEESAGDADYVRTLCARLNVPCAVTVIPRGEIAASARRGGTGIEAAARAYRMRALRNEARRLEAGGKKVRVCVAHTRDDLLETLLMRILRGAGPAGLAAMREKRGRLCRPLLRVSRADVLAYLGEKNIPWREDSTNSDIRFLRNKVRRCLVPALSEQFPRWRNALFDLAETQTLAAAFIADEARARVTWKKNGAGYAARADNFFAQSAVIREEALFQGIDLACARAADTVSVKRKNVRRFCQCARGGNAPLSAAADLGAARVRVRGGFVVVRKSSPRFFERGFSLLIKDAGLYTLKSVTIEVTKGLIQNEAAGSFVTTLPLVLRRTAKDDCVRANGASIARARSFTGSERRRLISAENQNGVAAFIGRGGLAAGVKMTDGAGFGAYTVTVKGK